MKPEPDGQADNPGPCEEDATNRRIFLSGAISLGSGLAGSGTTATVAGAESARADTPANPRLFSFVGGPKGDWSVVSARAVIGESLPTAERVDFVTGAVTRAPQGMKWLLRGVISNARYTTRGEKNLLVERQAELGRPEANLAALIPIRKAARWWDLTQDERREIFEETSRHIAIGLKYLPGIARRLYHCRDLGEAEPFDFLTRFEYAEANAAAFDDLVAALRATDEWKFVDREVDIRLARVSRR